MEGRTAVAGTHGIAGQILNQAGLTTYFIRKQVSKLVAAGSVTTGKSQIPFTPRARKVLDEADSIAKRAGTKPRINLIR